MELQDADKKAKALLEDVLVDLLYSKYKDLVFHGGTAIWRCYGGNRFSRDLDFYFNAKSKSPGECNKELSDFFKSREFSLKKRSYNRDTKTMQFLVQARGKMKVDINLGYKSGSPADYTRADGSKSTVLALTPIEILNEKIDAYSDKLSNQGAIKQPEAHDLYDIFYLTGIIKEKDDPTALRLGELLERIGVNQPPDIRGLGNLIISGVAPSFEFMIESIKLWMK